MLNSAEHEILSANEYENANMKIAAFGKKDFAIVCNWRFISRTNFILSWAEHEKFFMISEPVVMIQMNSDCKGTGYTW